MSNLNLPALKEKIISAKHGPMENESDYNDIKEFQLKLRK